MTISLHSQSVNVERTKLLAILKTNRTQHVKAYVQALKDYRLAILGDLEMAVLQAQDPNFDIRKLEVEFNAPVSYEQQYTNVIDLLEASVDKVINLDSSAFQAYYKDNWSWKSLFETSNRLYSTKAVSVSGRNGPVTISGAIGNAATNEQWPFNAPVAAAAKPQQKIAVKRTPRGSRK